MKLISFEIMDFRSISNAKCDVSPSVTVLAGKNESGKTNILEALEITTNNTKYTEFDKPKKNRNAKPEIRMTFRLEIDEMNKIKNSPGNLELSSTSKKLKEFQELCANEFTLVRFLDGNTFRIEGPFYEDCITIFEGIFNQILSTYFERIKDMDIINSEINLAEKFKFKQLENKKIEINETSIKEKRDIIKQFSSTNPEFDFSALDEKLVDLKRILEAKKNLQKDIRAITPRFIYYSSFDDKIPYEVSLEKIRNKNSFRSELRIVHDLFKLAKLDIEVFDTEDDLTRSTEVRKASKVYSKDFGKYWKQDPIEITIEDKKDHICIWVNDVGFEEDILRPEQRSKGLQWYLSFFIRLKSEGFENSIILIDEPGANLHAKAQQDVLDLLEEIAINNQVIFATHSPYLIDADKLLNIRLIERNVDTKETNIISSFNKGSDLETLTPIITAIGLDISRTLSFSKELNILLEGVSDYYYLTTVLKYLMKNKDYKFSSAFSFIPSIGHTKIPFLISILMGWGCEFCVLLDRKGTNKTHKMLLDEGIHEEKMIFVGKEENDSIENMFSQKDRERNNIEIYNEKDWEKWKKVKKEKSLVSKQFANNSLSDNFSLTEITQNNFIRVFDKIKSLK